MLTIKGNKITITAGDSNYFRCKLVQLDGSIYIPKGEDKLKFTARKTLNDEIAIQAVADEDCYIVLRPDMTSGLNGTYIYDVQLETEGQIYTVTQGYLQIIGEVTH